MWDNILSFFKNLKSKELDDKSRKAAKERLHLVLMQDRANVSADFLELMKQEIIEVIRKYVDIDEKELDVRLTNKANNDGTTGAPALYANIPIMSIKNEAKKASNEVAKQEELKRKEELAKKAQKAKTKRTSTNITNKIRINTETVKKAGEKVKQTSEKTKEVAKQALNKVSSKMKSTSKKVNSNKQTQKSKKD